MKQINHLRLREASNGCVLHDDGSMHLVLEVCLDYKILPIVAHKAFLEVVNSLTVRMQVTSRMMNANLGQKLLRYRAVQEKAILETKSLTSEHLATFRRFMVWFEQYCSSHVKVRRVYYLTLYSVPFLHSGGLSSFWFRRGKDERELIRKRLLLQAVDVAKILETVKFKVRLLREPELVKLYSSYYTFTVYDDQMGYMTIGECYQKWLEEGCEV